MYQNSTKPKKILGESRLEKTKIDLGTQWLEPSETIPLGYVKKMADLKIPKSTFNNYCFFNTSTSNTVVQQNIESIHVTVQTLIKTTSNTIAD